MRKVTLYTAVSQDGYIATLDHGISWLPSGDGEDYGYKEFYRQVQTVVMGHTTWNIVRALDPTAHNDRELIILSRKTHDGVALVREMRKGEGGIIWIVGGSIVNAEMLDANLIDEIILYEVPCKLGLGIPLFHPSGTSVPDPFKCVSVREFKSGGKQTTWRR